MDGEDKEVYEAFLDLIKQHDLDISDVMNHCTYLLAETLAEITNGVYSKHHVQVCTSVLEQTYNLMCGEPIDAAVIH